MSPTTILLTAISAMGSIAQGQAQKRAAEHNAAMARREAEEARMRAKHNKEMAAQAAETSRREQRRQIGRQRAAAGASGRAQGGSVVDILADQSLEHELDIQNILHQGELGIWEGENIATKAEAEAEHSIAQGKSAVTSSIFEAGGTVLGGFANDRKKPKKKKKMAWNSSNTDWTFNGKEGYL